jgi:glycosyltransferase
MGPAVENLRDHAVYKSEATVGEAIASVAAQTQADLEHVIVKGKSPDDSLAAIERAAHDRMRVISERDEGFYDALISSRTKRL